MSDYRKRPDEIQRTAQIPPAAPAPIISKFKQDLIRWRDEDCKNKLCIEGNVHTDDGEYVTCWNCPLCGHYRSVVPSAAIYQGPLEEWTDKEMEERRKEQMDLYYDRDLRLKRGIEVMKLLQSLTGRLEEKKI